MQFDASKNDFKETNFTVSLSAFSIHYRELLHGLEAGIVLQLICGYHELICLNRISGC